MKWEYKPSKKALKQITNTFDLYRDLTRITSSSKTKIDVVFSHKPERVTKSFNVVTGLSDQLNPHCQKAH